MWFSIANYLKNNTQREGTLVLKRTFTLKARGSHVFVDENGFGPVLIINNVQYKDKKSVQKRT